MSYKSLALFDFDGTITRKDSLYEFIRLTQPWIRIFGASLRLAVPLAFYKAGVLTAQRAKEYVFTCFFGNTGAIAFDTACEQFAAKHIPRFVRKEALERIRYHIRAGHRVIIVTASPENWVGKWAQAIGVECIGTRLETAGDVLTGRIAGANCAGHEKVVRVKQHLDLADYREIYTYGDSPSDWPFLWLGTCINYRPFRGRSKSARSG